METPSGFGYCERVGPGLFDEPLNAVTNLAFIAVAIFMYRRVRGQGLPLAEAMCLILFIIGLGSGLFHTLATRWAAAADVLPILIFVLTYFYAANRHFWGLRPRPAFGAMLLFFPYSAALTWVFVQVPTMAGRAPYVPVVLLIAGYAWVFRHRMPQTARNLAIGAAILALSLATAWADRQICDLWPHGTHFLWHLLNATMLGWMIETYRRHMLAARVPAL
jgi:hypothetical protein